jgi:hypothetical protein
MTIQHILNQLDGGITTANADRTRAMRGILRRLNLAVMPDQLAQREDEILGRARSAIRTTALDSANDIAELSFDLEGVAHADGRLGILKEVRGRLLKVEEEMI